MTERLRAQLSRILAAFRGGLGLAAPWADVWVRLSLAQAFFMSGLSKVGDWPVALELAQREYPVSWLDFHTAAVLGATVELMCPVLLVMGLAVRPAALALLVLSLVIQFSYQQLDVNLFWAALFAWYVAFGAGALSFDRAIRKGLEYSALPMAASIIRTTAWATRKLGPWYLVGLRAWLAVALAELPVQHAFFPVETFGALPRFLALAAATFLIVGLGTRPVSAVLVVVLSTGSMMLPAAGISLFAPLIFVLLTVFGGGRLSIDRIAAGRLDRPANPKPSAGPDVVIVGAGFAGMACARRLRGVHARVTIIDRRNYHLFQPLLYQVATASLSPGDVAVPIRALFREDPNVRVLCGEVSGVDTTRQAVLVDGQEIKFDYLVLATGASHGYFGNERWAAYAPGLKFVDDAVAIRGRILAAFEKAESTDDPAERERQLTFIICGGGPTGVELAGAIAELAHHGLESEFRRFDPSHARILLIQSGARILPTFPERLSAFAKTSLEGLGVEVRTGSRVEAIDQVGAVVGGTRIPAATVLWAAGVVASPAASWLDQPADAAGRLKVAEDLSVPGHPNIFATGDTASIQAWNGQPVPGLAPAAKQAGAYVGLLLSRKLRKEPPPAPFEYHHQGSLATIGRKSAVADFGWFTLSGAPAWWVWGAVHVFFLVGLRNRLSVIVGWVWSYVTYRVGVQLITGDSPPNNDRAGYRAPAKDGAR